MTERGVDRHRIHGLSRALVVLSFAVGFVAILLQSGKDLTKVDSQAVLTVLDAVYGTLRLFILEGPENLAESKNPSANWLLNAVRFVAPASLAGYLVTLSESLWRPLVQNYRLRKLKGHTVVLGGGEAAKALVRNLVKTGEKFVVIVQSADAATQWVR